MALSAISLFAGGGGLDLGLERAGIARTVCRVEHEAYACAVLAARSQDGSLDDAPIWSDVSTFDGKPWRGVVDLVAGGFPCQDISSAGKGAGIFDGLRSGLWREFARIIREVEPRYVFVENVSALLVRGLDVVLGDLAALGFDAEWGVFRAADVGAPHRRERVFVLAESNLRRCGQGIQSGELRAGIPGEPPVDPWPTRASTPREIAAWRGSKEPESLFGDAHSSGLHRVGCGCVHDGERSSRGGDAIRSGVSWPPSPGDAAGWADYLAHFPGLEPAIRRGADGMAHRTQRLRLLGNGVVPAQAALAWEVLMQRMTDDCPACAAPAKDGEAP